MSTNETIRVRVRDGIYVIPMNQLQSAVDYALKVAKESGEFGGGTGGTAEVYMRVSGGYIQYSTNNTAWTNLVSLDDLKGDPGEPGQPGAPGSDYVLTDDDLAEIAEMVVELLGGSGSGSGVEVDDTLTQPGKAADAQVTGEKIREVSEAIADLQNKTPSDVSGLTVGQIQALDGMFKIASYTEDPTAAYSAFKAAFGIEDTGEEEPDEPDTPTVTLTSISAAYSGGDVAVGTALTDLTGIVVNAHYSDGSTATVTDYTLSGEIAEGSNTITVSYSGKTATFTVTGVAESEGENNGWTDGVPYELNKVEGLTLDTTTGETVETTETGRMVTDFLPCLGVSAFEYEMYDSASIYNNVLYDENKNFIKANGLLSRYIPGSDSAYTETNSVVVPRDIGAAYVRFTQRSNIKYLTSVTPCKYPTFTENTIYETGRWYDTDVFKGSLNSATGVITPKETSTWYTTAHMLIFGASKVIFSIVTRKTVVFYDTNKNYISGTTVNNTVEFDVPENAAYVVASSTDMINQKIWIE